MALAELLDRIFPAAEVVIDGDGDRAQGRGDEHCVENAHIIPGAHGEEIGKRDAREGAELRRDHRHDALARAAHGVDKAAVDAVEGRDERKHQ